MMIRWIVRGVAIWVFVGAGYVVGNYGISAETLLVLVVLLVLGNFLLAASIVGWG